MDADEIEAPTYHADLQRNMLLRHETREHSPCPLGSGELPLHLIAEFGPGGAPDNLSRLKLIYPANLSNTYFRAFVGTGIAWSLGGCRKYKNLLGA